MVDATRLTKFSGVNWNKEMFSCSADHGQDWQAYPQLPPFIGAPRVCCGHPSGIYFPRLLWFGGYATHVTQSSVPVYSYFTMCSEKSEHICLTSYWYTAAILARFFFIRVFKEVLSLNLSNRNKKTPTVTSKKHASRPATATQYRALPWGLSTTVACTRVADYHPKNTEHYRGG